MNSADWCNSLYVIERIIRTLDESVGHRGIKVVVSSLIETCVLTRAGSGDRGALYQELTSEG